MKLLEEGSATSVIVSIDPFEDSEYFDSVISIQKFMDFKTQKWRLAKINWSAIGPTDHKHTELFIKGLQKAIDIRDMMDTNLYKVTAIFAGMETIEKYFSCSKKSDEFMETLKDKGYMANCEYIHLA